MSDQIRVNGIQHSWGSIILKVDGERFYGFTAISYSDKLEVSKAYGMSKDQSPRGRSRGKYSTENVQLTGWKASIQELREALAKLSPSGKSYGQVVFQIVVQFIETGDKPITVEIEDCRFVGNSEKYEEGADALSDEIEIDCMRIRRNGAVLFEEAT